MNLFSSRNVERFLIAASVALMVPLSAVAFGGQSANPGRCGGAEMRGGPGTRGAGEMPPYLHGLNLTEAQRDKVFEIMHGQAPAMRDKAKAARKADEDLRALGIAADYSEAKAKALTDVSAKAMAEMSLARVKVDRQVFEVLTPEQRKQAAEFKLEREQPHGRGDGPRGKEGERPPLPPR